MLTMIMMIKVMRRIVVIMSKVMTIIVTGESAKAGHSAKRDNESYLASPRTHPLDATC